jgi:hypothetical protein
VTTTVTADVAGTDSNTAVGATLYLSIGISGSRRRGRSCRSSLRVPISKRRTSFYLA